MRLGDYAVTEAGFGADLGAENVFGYQVPLCRPEAFGRRDGRDHSRTQDAWRAG